MKKFNQEIKDKPSFKKIAKIALPLVFASTLVGLVATFPGEVIEVKKGSTLFKIAQQYGTTWQKLEKRNNLKDPDYIRAGEELIIYNDNARGFFQMIGDLARKYWF